MNTVRDLGVCGSIVAKMKARVRNIERNFKYMVDGKLVLFVFFVLLGKMFIANFREMRRQLSLGSDISNVFAPPHV